MKNRTLFAIALTTLSPALVAGSDGLLDLRDAVMAINATHRGQIVAVEVEQHRTTIASLRLDRSASQSLIDVRSAGKSITALAVALAIADNRIESVNVPVWLLLGAPPEDPRAAITVRDLLTMSSQLDCDDDVSKSPGQEERMYRTSNWTAFAMRIPPQKILSARCERRRKALVGRRLRKSGQQVSCPATRRALARLRHWLSGSST